VISDGAEPGTQTIQLLPPHTFILDGHRLRQLRQQRGLSQAKLADQAEVSLTTVARLERRRHSPCRGWTLGRLARALGEPPATMILEPGPSGPGNRAGWRGSQDKRPVLFQLNK
jgi:DNA-binding XRE family transcriptional regulator